MEFMSKSKFLLHTGLQLPVALINFILSSAREVTFIKHLNVIHTAKTDMKGLTTHTSGPCRLYLKFTSKSSPRKEPLLNKTEGGTYLVSSVSIENTVYFCVYNAMHSCFYDGKFLVSILKSHYM